MHVSELDGKEERILLLEDEGASSKIVKSGSWSRVE